jgi:hypothetical protein
MNATWDPTTLTVRNRRVALEAHTSVGRCFVKQWRPGVPRWIAWVNGKVIGRDFDSIDAAMHACESEVIEKLLRAKDVER